MNIYGLLRESLRRAVKAHWPAEADVAFVVVEPDNAEHGDLATNCAMVLAKRVKSAPIAVAETLRDALSADKELAPFLEKIEIVKPGFINLFLGADALAHASRTLSEAPTWVEKRDEKIVIEHTNVNPNKAMHIGHLRNAILGDTINTVLRRAGFKTEVQYYVDDTGVQVADTYLGMKELQVQQSPGEKFDHYCWRVYTDITNAYQQDPELLTKRTLILHELEKGDSETAKDVKRFAERILRDHLTTMSAFHIAYDILIWESDILGFGFWQHAFEKLQTSDAFIKEKEGKNAGCWVLRTGEESDDEEHSPDKVIVKSDGTVTYTGKDVAYHLWKYDLLGKDFLYSTWKDAPQDKALVRTDQRGTESSSFGRADRVYNVIDVRQSYPQAMVKLALQSLGYAQEADSLRHVSYGIVSLSPKTAAQLGLATEDGKSVYSMSGRKGIGIKVDDLVQQVEKRVAEKAYDVTSDRSDVAVSPREVAVGAIKYFMLRYNPATDIVFDLDEALSLEGNTGPYIQYAHARMAGILEKSSEHAFAFPKQCDFSPEETRLLKKLYQWNEVLDRTSEDLHVNAITTYAFELANAFNSFYEAQPVLKAEGDLRQQRLALVALCKTVLADVLHTLGIVAPEKM